MCMRACSEHLSLSEWASPIGVYQFGYCLSMDRGGYILNLEVACTPLDHTNEKKIQQMMLISLMRLKHFIFVENPIRILP